MESIIENQDAISLTPNEKAILKSSIIESQNSEWAYSTIRRIKSLTEGERMVLKGIFLRTNNPSSACTALCDTDFISILASEERARLRQLAAQVKNKYEADRALKHIYDLTPEERVTLEKIAAYEVK